jgi:hypothetical protein
MCNLGFEVLTAVVMKSSIFWDITPCSQLKASHKALYSRRKNTSNKCTIAYPIFNALL